MMKRIIIFFSVFLLLFIFGKENIQASGFNLRSIGGVDTSGRLYSRWYHTSLQPTLQGEALANSTVEIIIDDQSFQATADGNGQWSFTPPSLTPGDHSVVLKNNGSEIKFTLTLGKENVNWEEIQQGGGETLPAVGIVTPTFLLLLFGFAFSGGSLLINQIASSKD